VGVAETEIVNWDGYSRLRAGVGEGLELDSFSHIPKGHIHWAVWEAAARGGIEHQYISCFAVAKPIRFREWQLLT